MNLRQSAHRVAQAHQRRLAGDLTAPMVAAQAFAAAARLRDITDPSAAINLRLFHDRLGPWVFGRSPLNKVIAMTFTLLGRQGSEATLREDIQEAAWSLDNLVGQQLVDPRTPQQLRAGTDTSNPSLAVLAATAEKFASLLDSVRDEPNGLRRTEGTLRAWDAQQLARDAKYARSRDRLKFEKTRDRVAGLIERFTRTAKVCRGLTQNIRSALTRAEHDKMRVP